MRKKIDENGNIVEEYNEINEEFDEEETVECFKCKGQGVSPVDFKIMLYDPCPKCQGIGEVDWTKNLVTDYDSLKPDILQKFFERNLSTIKRYLTIEAEKMGFVLEIDFLLRHMDDMDQYLDKPRRKKKRA